MKTERAHRIAAIMLVLIPALLFAESFSGNLLVRPAWTHEKSGATTASEAFGTLLNWTFTSGATTNQMNQLWVSRRTLTNSATETIDLAGGVTNSFGTVLTISEVRMMVVKIAATQTNGISVGAAADHIFSTWLGDGSDAVSIRPGGFFLLVGPDATAYPVSTNGNLKVTNDGTNTVIYDIYIGGSDQ